MNKNTFYVRTLLLYILSDLISKTRVNNNIFAGFTGFGAEPYDRYGLCVCY